MTSAAPNKIDLWYARPATIDDDTAMHRCYPLLSAAEREQHGRFQFPADRKAYLITRALVRTVLSKYAPLSPPAWRFETNRYGRPLIARDCLAIPVHFSISHTRELIVCAIGPTEEVGVDTERLDRQEITLELAERYFATSELENIKALAGLEQHRRLLEHWTLKEAYTKARGQGLHLPLDGVAFAFESGNRIGASFDERVGDRAEAWQFGHLAPIDHHLIAYAARPAEPGALSVQARETTPF